MNSRLCYYGLHAQLNHARFQGRMHFSALPLSRNFAHVKRAAINRTFQVQARSHHLP